MRGKLSTTLFLFLPMLALGAAHPKNNPEKASAQTAAPASTSTPIDAKKVTSSGSRFEGIIDLKLTLEAGSGDLSLSLSGDMAKLDMQIKVGPLPEPIRLAVIMDAKTPKTAYMLSERTKTFSSINLAEAGKRADDDKAKAKYKVKILGQEKILGFVCSHLTLTREGELIDAWITQEMPDVYVVLKKLQEANPQIGEPGLFRALEETGNAGLPMRCIVVRDGQRVTTEVKKVDRRTLAASLFAIPKDYVRTEGGAVGLQPTPEQVEEMKKVIQGAMEGQ
jgi:Domain of unknown function (DUF4412)